MQLGFLVNFVSTPVIAGFTSAAAFTIASNQIKNVFGLNMTEESDLPGILQTYAEVGLNIESIRWADTGLGIAGIIVLLILKVG